MITADALARVLIRILRMAASTIEKAVQEADDGEVITSAPPVPGVTQRPLTARQAECLAIIRRSIRERGYPPTLREIGGELGIHSTNGVNDHLEALIRKGWLSRDPMTARGLIVHEEPAVGANGVAS